MSLEYIHQLSREAAREAADLRLEPYQPWNTAEILSDDFIPFPFPFIGDYDPPGWTCVTWLFCDSSGLGAPDEPALTGSQLIQKLVKLQELGISIGYAITETGQFQLHLGCYVPDRHIDLVEEIYAADLYLDEDTPEYHGYDALFCGKGVYPQI